ncbi:Type IV secretion system protein VirB11 [Burkholderiales bacterium]|nr:Type IV secretion system protein VirB11 [Burkholderiales bacterium]
MDGDGSVLEEGNADVYAEDLCITQFLRPLRQLLNHGMVTEVCVNEPGRVHVETSDGWHCLDVPQMSYERCMALATAVATFGDQRLSEGAPLLSTTLPSGERIQIAVPPVTARSRVSITIRKPSAILHSLAELDAQGMFSRIQCCEAPEPGDGRLLEGDRQLLELLGQGGYPDFFRLAVRDKRTIVVAGDTGSGKTSFIKSLLQEVPREERLITIEDAAEITLPEHPNKVHLYYSQGKQGVADVTATELLRACLRMKPDRIFLGELRGPEAWDFLNVCASGHPGGMSSVHAASCALTFERLAFLVGQSSAAATLNYEQIKRLLLLVVDIVAHIERVPGKGRFVRELYFDPLRKLAEARI